MGILNGQRHAQATPRIVALRSDATVIDQITVGVGKEPGRCAIALRRRDRHHYALRIDNHRFTFRTRPTHRDGRPRGPGIALERGHGWGTNGVIKTIPIGTERNVLAEVQANQASVHIEQMDPGHYWISIAHDHGGQDFALRARGQRRAEVVLTSADG